MYVISHIHLWYGFHGTEVTDARVLGPKPATAEAASALNSELLLQPPSKLFLAGILCVCAVC